MKNIWYIYKKELSEINYPDSSNSILQYSTMDWYGKVLVWNGLKRLILITLLITLLGSVSDLLDFQRFSDFENARYSSIPLRSTKSGSANALPFFVVSPWFSRFFAFLKFTEICWFFLKISHEIWREILMSEFCWGRNSNILLEAYFHIH